MQVWVLHKVCAQVVAVIVLGLKQALETCSH